MADYLKSRSYKKIAVITGDKNLGSSVVEAEKIKMLREDLAGYTDIPDEHIFNIPTAVKYEGLTSATLEKVITKKFCNDFEMIICFNTNAIVLIYRRLFELRLIPGKDIDLMAKCSAGVIENLVPSITHVEVPNFIIGEQLSQCVINEIKNKTSNKEFICIEAELIIGESSRK
jgi:DNA-binding LacI/PurR family transcriptional regulator